MRVVRRIIPTKNKSICRILQVKTVFSPRENRCHQDIFSDIQAMFLKKQQIALDKPSINTRITKDK